MNTVKAPVSHAATLAIGALAVVLAPTWACSGESLRLDSNRPVEAGDVVATKLNPQVAPASSLQQEALVLHGGQAHATQLEGCNLFVGVGAYLAVHDVCETGVGAPVVWSDQLSGVIYGLAVIDARVAVITAAGVAHSLYYMNGQLLHLDQLVVEGASGSIAATSGRLFLGGPEGELVILEWSPDGAVSHALGYYLDEVIDEPHIAAIARHDDALLLLVSDQLFGRDHIVALRIPPGPLRNEDVRVLSRALIIDGAQAESLVVANSRAYVALPSESSVVEVDFSDVELPGPVLEWEFPMEFARLGSIRSIEPFGSGVLVAWGGSRTQAGRVVLVEWAVDEVSIREELQWLEGRPGRITANDSHVVVLDPMRELRVFAWSEDVGFEAQFAFDLAHTSVTSVALTHSGEILSTSAASGLWRQSLNQKNWGGASLVSKDVDVSIEIDGTGHAYGLSGSALFALGDEFIASNMQRIGFADLGWTTSVRAGAFSVSDDLIVVAGSGIVGRGQRETSVLVLESASTGQLDVTGGIDYPVPSAGGPVDVAVVGDSIAVVANLLAEAAVIDVKTEGGPVLLSDASSLGAVRHIAAMGELLVTAYGESVRLYELNGSGRGFRRLDTIRASGEVTGMAIHDEQLVIATGGHVHEAVGSHSILEHYTIQESSIRRSSARSPLVVPGQVTDVSLRAGTVAVGTSDVGVGSPPDTRRDSLFLPVGFTSL